MKFTLIILTVLAPFFAHAGGGGGLRPGMQTMMMTTNLGNHAAAVNFANQTPKIVFNVSELNGWTKFAYGQLVDRQWQIRHMEIPTTELITHTSLADALQNSSLVNDWVEVE